MKSVVILGCTGSIGRSAVEITGREKTGEFKVVGLAAGKNLPELSSQLKLFPEARFALGSEEAYGELVADPALAERGAGFGQEGILNLLEETRPDLVVNALVGIAGLMPTFRSIEMGSRVALANKESLVTAGELLTREFGNPERYIIPVDSEHFSLSRCLKYDRSEISEIIITASGGPFYGRDYDSLSGVTIEQVLDHPTWDMGDKVTVDSALLLNKGLEVVEAHWLFGFPYRRIKVLIHPQSLVHSLIRMVDGSLVAHLGPPDMRLPIMNALYHPRMVDFPWESLRLEDAGNLEFRHFRSGDYPAFELVMKAAERGGTSLAVLNAADEVAVNTFLSGKIGFLEIIDWIEEALSLHGGGELRDIGDVLEADRRTRESLAGRHDEAVII